MLDLTERPVQLDDMLTRREARVATRETLLARWRRPVVTFTLVMPGPLKDTAAARLVHEEGRRALCFLLGGPGFGQLAAVDETLATGPESFRVIDASPIVIKEKLVALEDSHPLGRLWDLDVSDALGRTVSRGDLGLPPRRCFLCAEPAHACARGNRHGAEEVQAAVRAIIDDYRLRPDR